MTFTMILGWIVFGLIVGLIAKAIMPGRDPGGVIMTILLGIVGAILGGYVGQVLLGYGRVARDGRELSEPGFLVSLILAVFGVILLLVIYRLITNRSLRM